MNQTHPIRRHVPPFALLFVFALVGVFALGLVGCGQVQGGHNLDSGTVDVDGKTLTVKLATNPTTGYAWTSEVDGTGLELTSDEVSEGEQDLVGGPSVETFTFTGQGAGTTTITLTYARSFEETDDEKVITIEVVTNDDGTIKSEEATETGPDGESSGSVTNG